MERTHARILIVGLARSGLAAARLVAATGATAVLTDMREAVEGIEALDGGAYEVHLGVAAEGLVAGCDLVIVSPAVPPDAPVIAEAARLGIPVEAELGYAARHVRGTQIAITGTNGKTTTCALVGEILRNAGKSAFVAGNIGLPLSAVAPQTTDETVTVIEVSSFQLEHMPDFHPHIAAILNLTPDHLNRHGSMAAYGALKAGMLANQTAEDFFVYNADDAFCRGVAEAATAGTVAFSRTRALDGGAWVEGGQLVLEGRALCALEDIKLPGPHNLENALAAAAIAARLDVPPAVIRHSLRSFAGVAHRMETVREVRGVRWINDSKGTNPESSMRAVEGMHVPTVLIAGGDEKGNDFAGLAVAVAANPAIRHVVLMGRTAQRLREALAAAGYGAVTDAGFDLAEAVEIAGGLAEAGGAVLLSPACASFDMFKDFEARGDAFRALVEGLG